MIKTYMPYKVQLTIENSVFELVEIDESEYEIVMDTAHYYDPYFLYKRLRCTNRDNDSDAKYKFHYIYKAIVINGKYFMPVLKSNIEPKKEEPMPESLRETIDEILSEPTFEQAIDECISDAVNHPNHYGGADNPYEAIKVIEAHDMNFNLGNAVKYILRAGKKGDAKQDLEKAVWYLKREISRL